MLQQFFTYNLKHKDIKENILQNAETVARRCSVKKMFLEIW